METKYLYWIMVIITIIATIPALLTFKEEGKALEPKELKEIKTDYTKDLRHIIRTWRMRACSQGYLEYENHIKQVYRLQENLILRCFAFMSLVYAYESWFWQSRMCLQDYNCFWIKEPTYKWVLKDINYNIWWNRFLILDSFDDNNLLFARLYYRWHLNKSIEVFVNWWSMTDQGSYIKFMRDNYNHFINEWQLLINELKNAKE